MSRVITIGSVVLDLPKSAEVQVTRQVVGGIYDEKTLNNKIIRSISWSAQKLTIQGKGYLPSDLVKIGKDIPVITGASIIPPTEPLQIDIPGVYTGPALVDPPKEIFSRHEGTRQWSLICYIDAPTTWEPNWNLDISGVPGVIVGSIGIEFSEGLSAVATVQSRINSGSMASAIGNKVNIDSVFKGYVDRVSYDARNNIATFYCSDRLNATIKKKSKEDLQSMLETATGEPVWSRHLFSYNATTDTFFRDIMSSVKGTVQLLDDKLVYTPWKEIRGSRAIPVNALDVSIEPADYTNIPNEVQMVFELRYKRLYERNFTLSWHLPMGYLLAGFTAPDHATVASAISSSGWCVESYVPKPKPPLIISSHLLPWSVKLFPSEPGSRLYYDIVYPYLGETLSEEDYLVGNLSPKLLENDAKELEDTRVIAGNLIMNPIPNTGFVENPVPFSQNSVGFISDEPRFSKVGGFSARVIKRYSQPVLESQLFNFKSPDMLSLAGSKNSEKTVIGIEITDSRDYTAQHWEESRSVAVKYRVSDASGISYHRTSTGQGGLAANVASFIQTADFNINTYTVRPPGPASGGSEGMSYWDRDRDPLYGRAEADKALKISKNIVLKRFAEAKRAGSFIVTTPYSGAKKVGGGIKKIAHSLNIESGQARTVTTYTYTAEDALGKPTNFTKSPKETKQSDFNKIKKEQDSTYFSDISKFLKGDNVRELKTWPEQWDSTAKVAAASPPETLKFRGWNCYTGEMLVECPGFSGDFVSQRVYRADPVEIDTDG
jgi:hypothetical protein